MFIVVTQMNIQHEWHKGKVEVSNLLKRSYQDLISLTLPSEHEAQHEQQRAALEETNASTTLLTLPAELRDHIYTDLIPRDLCIILKRTSDGRFVPASERTALATMQTCRQIRQETLPIYYGQNIFPCGFGRSNILPALSDDAIACLRRIEIHGFYHCEHREGRGRLQMVTILIDRWEGTMLEREMDMPGTIAIRFQIRHATPTCLARREEHVVRLKGLIESAGLLDRSTVLTNESIRELARVFNQGGPLGESWISRTINGARNMLGV